MSEGIYLEMDGKLIDMRAAPYEKEDDLQQLLERHAVLLAGDQITPALDSRRFVLVRREAGIPDSAFSGDRWSVDHVFLDQDGVVTLVEAKRSTNPQIRREIVGQLLEYAANAVVYWPTGSVRTQFEQTHGTQDGVAFERLRYLLNLGDAEFEAAEEDIEAFWETVESNLRSGRIRMLFVADKLPPELRRIIEFLNEQMSPADVLGIEVRNYVSTGSDQVRALVPTVIGLTEAAQQAKARPSTDSPPIEEALANASEPVQEVRAKLDAWATSRGLVQWNEGKSRRYSPTKGPGALVSLYPAPMYQSVYFLLTRVDDLAVRSKLKETISSLLERSVNTDNPAVTCSVLLQNWESFESTFLTPLATASSSTPPTDAEPPTQP